MLQEYKKKNLSVYVTEIYFSIQGESTWAGVPCTFIRLTGCPLRCVWCDTEYAFHNGTKMKIGAILDKVEAVGCPLVEVTGGEPLAQTNCGDLLEVLVEAGYTVLLETSGAFSLSRVPEKVHVIMDIKCPGSGQMHMNLWGNLSLLKRSDEVKFVIASQEDYEWAKGVAQREKLSEKCGAILLSPAYGLVSPTDLAEWMLADNWTDARLQIQLHKMIWSPTAKGV